MSYTLIAPIHKPAIYRIPNLTIATRTNGMVVIVAPVPWNPFRPATGQMYPR